MLVMKSQRLLKRMLGVAGRILGIAGTGKPPGWIYQRKPTPEGVGCSF